MDNKVKKELGLRNKIWSIIISGIVMTLGLVLFKYLPMLIFGSEIEYDASMHIVLTVFVLYFLWYFIDQNEKWKIPYFIFCGAVIIIVGVQRILVNAHNDIGVLFGLIISMIGVIVSRWEYFKDKISF